MSADELARRIATDPATLAETPPLPPGVSAVADLTWALGEFASRRAAYTLYHAYLDGDHRLTFATKGYREAFRTLLAGLRCNLCPRIVHALTDRLRLVGFDPHHTDVGGPSAHLVAGKAAAQRARALWQDGRLDRHANQVHTEAVAAGDAYLIVWPDPDEPTVPRFYPQSATDVVVRYDAERCDRIILAAKFWQEGRSYRLNLYYPDRIEKFVTKAKRVEGTPEKASQFEPLPDDEAVVTHDYGRVPVFHFAFEGGIGQYGKAELRDIIPLQDALNKELCDMLVASEFGAFPMKYAIGVDADADTGEHSLKVGIDRLITVLNKDAKLGSFAATDLAAYRDTLFAFAELMALVKGIPLHVLRMSGAIPSGESLKTAEAPLIARVEDTQTDFGDVWEDALAFSLRIAGEADDAPLTAVWAPAASRAEKDHVDTIATKVREIGISRAQAWRELGYSEVEIAAMEVEKEAEGVASADAFDRMLGQQGAAGEGATGAGNGAGGE